MFETTPLQAVPAGLDVQAFRRRCEAQWWGAPDGLPALGPTYSRGEQAEREAALSRLVDRALKAAEARSLTPEQEAALRQELTPEGLRVLGLALGLQPVEVGALQPEQLAEVALEFARQARRSDPALTPADIFQAGRNVMTANVLQLLLGRPVALTPGIFAYSLLYPYTDNLLDDPRLPAAAKHAFNDRFGRRLAGEATVPADQREERVAALVTLIEDQFSRTRYPQVYAGLLAIHAAQADSLRLSRPGAAPYEVDVLGLTLAKGGTSVLADGCLVAGHLRPVEAECLYGLGAYLQLLDDLEDVDRDRREGRQTLFAAMPHSKLDGLTSRTLHFGAWVLASFDRLEAPVAEMCRAAIQHCMLLPALQLAGAAASHYSRAYLAQLEAHSPFRFAFARAQQRRLARRRRQWLRLLDTYTAPDRADRSAPWSQPGLEVLRLSP